MTWGLGRERRLVCGLRRLMACRDVLGLVEIPATVIDLENPLLAERDENEQRQPFTPSEAVEIAEAIEKIEREKARERQREGGKKAGRGRPIASSDSDEAKPSQGRSDTRAAKAVGMGKDKLAKARAVKKAADEEPDVFGYLVEKMDRTGRRYEWPPGLRRLPPGSRQSHDRPYGPFDSREAWQEWAERQA